MSAGAPPPFEGLVVILAWCLAAALCLGALSARSWRAERARLARRALAAAAVALQLAFHLLAPPRSALESAGRFVFLWPAAVVALAAAAAWGWRDSRRGARPGIVADRSAEMPVP